MTEQAVDQAQPTISPEEMEKLRQEWVRTQLDRKSVV